MHRSACLSLKARRLRVYDAVGNVIETHEHAGEFKEWQALKVMRMDGRPYPDESHDHPEGLLVIDGQLNLTIGNEAITVHAGELFVVPVGVAHAVAPGSAGTLIIFDA